MKRREIGLGHKRYIKGRRRNIQASRELTCTEFGVDLVLNVFNLILTIILHLQMKKLRLRKFRLLLNLDYSFRPFMLPSSY